MAWTQATINNLKPTDKNYKKQEDNLVVMITPAGSITYYAYIRRNLEYLGTHPELTLRNAKKKKLDMFADMYMGKLEESKMTFEEFVFSNDFQEWSIGHRKTHVARMNSMTATILPKLGKVKLAKINKVDINRYKNARLKQGVKHSTINRELSDISGVLTQAFEMEYINLPIKVQKFPEDRGKERRVLDDWEVKALRDSAHSIEGLNTRQAKQKKHIGLIIDIALWCGLRKGEILKLRWGDIVNKGIFVKEYQKSLENNPPDSEAFIESAFSDFAFNIRGDTTKTGQSRFVPITSELLRELVEYYFVNVGIKSSKTFAEDMLKKAKEFKVTGDYNISDIGFDKFIVQPQHKKQRIFPFKKVDNSFNTARDKAGIGKDITLHSLRHDFCSKSLEAGMPLHDLKDLAGHASITTTEIYLHSNPKNKFEQYQKFASLRREQILSSS
jgi:integrase